MTHTYVHMLCINFKHNKKYLQSLSFFARMMIDDACILKYFYKKSKLTLKLLFELHQYAMLCRNLN